MIRLFLSLLSLVVAQAAVQKPQTYWHMCDASAAVALDDQRFVVADDEGNVLRIFKRGEPEPISEHNLTKFLDAKKGESDLEGAAKVGDRIYWISSHGVDKNGKSAPNRQRFFATGIDLQPVGTPYRSLLKDINFDPSTANIEGMCARADGSLLIGFRTPLRGTRAVLVPFLNPSQVIQGEAAKFGEVIEIDTGGYGIRDICPVGDKFLALAGSTGGRKSFRLYLWDGKKAEFLPGFYFDKLNPEALFRFPNDAADVIQVLSDDGGNKCKDLKKEERHFRAGEFSIPQLRP